MTASIAPEHPSMLGEYELREELGRGAHSVVYRAQRGEKTVAIKVSHGDARKPEAKVLQFRREAAALARIQHPGIAAILEVNRTSDGRSYLVMEYVEGRTLAEVMRDAAGPVPEAVVRHIARELCGVLGEVHRRGFVHRDLKPANIILTADGNIKLLDFGLAATMQDSNEASVAGTFAYTPPEQTGMLNREIDGRSDLYSLGVIMFECLAGRPLFQSADVADLIRKHAMEPAPELHALSSSVSLLTSRIVHKLLAKDPDDRYQSAEGLSADLRLEPAHDAVRPLDQTTVSSRDLGAFVQREAQCEQLAQGLGRARSGAGQLFVLSGDPGAGKTRLAKEFARTVREAGGRVLWGESMESDPIPFEPFAAIVRGLVREARAASTSHASVKRLQRAAGDYAPFLVRVFPELDQVLSVSSHQREVEADQSVHYDAVCHFLTSLAAGDPPFLLVLEDIQRLDKASLQVLRRMARAVAKSPLLIVTSVRSEHQDAAIKELDLPRQAVIDLPPLDEGGVSAMLAHHLGGGTISPEIIHALKIRSHGNPLAVHEYLHAMLDAGVLTPHWGTWKLDRDALDKLEHPKDLTHLLLRRLVDLDDESRRVLRLAALLGRQFDAGTLALLCEKAGLDRDTSVERVLLNARAAHLIEDGAGDQVYRFLHDRTRSHLYDELPEAERRTLHLHAAKLEQTRGEPSLASWILSARHHFLGHTHETAEQAYEASLRASIGALEGHAPVEAKRLCEQALEIAVRYRIEPGFELYRCLAEAQVQVGYSEESIVNFERAVEGCADPVLRAQMRTRVAEIHIWVGFDTIAAGKEVDAAFVDLGLSVPRRNWTAIVASLWYFALAMLVDLFRVGYGRERLAAVAKVRYKLFETRGIVGFLECDNLVVLHMCFRCLYAGLLVGPSRELVSALSSYAAAFSSLSAPRFLVDRYMQRAYAMAKELGDPVAYTRTQWWHSVQLDIQGEMRRSDELLYDLVAHRQQWLDSNDLLGVYNSMSVSLLVRGHTQAVVEQLSRCIDAISAKAGTEVGITGQLPLVLSVASAAHGRTDEPLRHMEALRDKVKDPRSVSSWLMLWGYRVIWLGETGDYGHAYDEACIQCERPNVHPLLGSWPMHLWLLNMAYGRYEQYLRADANARPMRLAQLRRAARQVGYCATRQPAFRCHAHMIRGIVVHLRGQHERALKMFAKAQRFAQRDDSPWGEFEALRQSARVLRVMGHEDAARRTAIAAMGIAGERSWVHRAERLGREFSIPTIFEAQRYAPEAEGSGGRLRSERIRRVKRDRDVLLEINLASSAILDPVAQVCTTLDKLAELLGAERALIFLLNEKKGRLELLVARDAQKQDLPSGMRIARSIVERTFRSKLPLVLNGTDEGAALGFDSVVAHDLRSIICAPLIVRDQAIGVIYLDNRLAKGVFTSGDLDILQAVANQIAISQESARHARREIERRELERDLQLSAAVQSLLLPAQSTMRSADIEIAGFFQPASVVAGDWWFYDVASEGTIRILLGDVTGHGAGSAMVTSAMAGCYRALNALNRDEPHRRIDTPQIIARMHRALRDICADSFNMPFSAVEVEPRTGDVRWWSAAAPVVLLLQADGSVESKVSPGRPLGGSELVLGEQSWQLAPGQCMLLFSDGVLEMELPEQRTLGMRKLSQLLSSCRGASAIETRDRLSQELQEARRDVPLMDDLTFVVVTRHVS